jgi:hypothetical protein
MTLIRNIERRVEIEKNDFRKESSIFRFTLIFHYVLTNLQFAFKFICPFIIGKGPLRGDEVENQFVFTVVVNVSSNQLRISQHAPYIWSTLKQKIPLAFNLVVH